LGVNNVTFSHLIVPFVVVRLYLGGGWAKPENGVAVFGRGVGGAV